MPKYNLSVFLMVVGGGSGSGIIPVTLDRELQRPYSTWLCSSASILLISSEMGVTRQLFENIHSACQKLLLPSVRSLRLS